MSPEERYLKARSPLLAKVREKKEERQVPDTDAMVGSAEVIRRSPHGTSCRRPRLIKTDGLMRTRTRMSTCIRMLDVHAYPGCRRVTRLDQRSVTRDSHAVSRVTDGRWGVA